MIRSHLFKNDQKLSDQDWPAVWEEALKNGCEFLDLSKNSFSEIPPPGFQLPNLKVLDISYNQNKPSRFPSRRFPGPATFVFVQKPNSSIPNRRPV